LVFTISRWSRALIRSSSLRFASTARDMSSFMSSASGLPRIMSIIAGSRFLRSTGGRSDGALSRGVEFSIDHLRRDCIVQLVVLDSDVVIKICVCLVVI
jgi:hypothetical protein